MVESTDFKNLRQLLMQLDPLPAHHADSAPNISSIYSPSGHEAALDPERPLVVGGRGVGKSFWAGVLTDDTTRNVVAGRYPRLGLDKCRVALGFSGLDTAQGGPPSPEVVTDLMEKDGFKAEHIWRAVILHALKDYVDDDIPSRWAGSNGLVAWAAEDAERLQLTLQAADRRLAQDGLRQVVVFDGLDRLGSDWTQIRERTKALMRVILAFRSYKAIKPKIFMRIDQAQDQSLAGFPDASKLLGAKVDLAWECRDLFGLLFMVLANNPLASTSFRKLVAEHLGISLKNSERVGLPSDLTDDEHKQELLFAAMAGPYMGSDRRRGKTYAWVYNHLADAYGQVSPRTFLVAFRVASEHGQALDDKVVDPKGLQAGLRAASAQRVEQLQEDFSWIRQALEPLADLNVPCFDDSVFARWYDAKTVAAIQRSSKTEKFLEPVEFSSGESDTHKSLLDAMRRIGVAERRPDGRINVPDIYRVAARLLRRGGVRP
jgi:hypothetical protein